jgi:predicted PurR-regulated permease PerM/uncharacterized protein YjbJ (UPF0337 family)
MDQEELEAMYKEAADLDRAAAEGTAKEVEGAVQEAVGVSEHNEQARAEGEAKKLEGRRISLLSSVGRTLFFAGRNILSTNNNIPARAATNVVAIDGPSDSLPDLLGPSVNESSEDERSRSTADEMTRNLARWQLRRDVPLAILAWIGVIYIVLISAGHIGSALLILVIAALLAYALTPAVKLFERIMPRFLAVAIVYIIVLGGVSALIYFIVQTALQQFASLSGLVGGLLQPSSSGPLNTFERSLGLQPSQIESIRQQILATAQGLIGSILPFVTGVFGTIVDIIIIAVLSIYFLLDGQNVIRWLRNNAPRQQRGRMGFALDTLQRIVGGYIRGQILLCTLIGILVGGGMYFIGVPYALLLGVLTFILEFIPILGTLVSGVICVLLALTKGWVIALIVVIYFVVVHIIEGDVVGPRIVGKAVGLHPIVALAALVAGGELFGIWGSLFASPVAGVLQALLITIWIEWRDRHPKEFQQTKQKALDTVSNNVADKPLNKEAADKLLS